MTLVVLLASAEALGICAAHMRRVLDEDLRGYHPRWHCDLDELAGSYLDRAGAGTVRRGARRDVRGDDRGQTGRCRHPPAPAWLSQRYSAQPTGQLARVWIVRELRRAESGTPWSPRRPSGPLVRATTPSCASTPTPPRSAPWTSGGPTRPPWNYSTLDPIPGTPSTSNSISAGCRAPDNLACPGPGGAPSKPRTLQTMTSVVTTGSQTKWRSRPH